MVDWFSLKNTENIRITNQKQHKPSASYIILTAVIKLDKELTRV